MRDKYITEEFPHWFIHGVLVIASNTRRESDINVNEHDAEKLITEHNLTVDKLVETAIAWSKSDPKGFEKYWYKDTI